MIGIIFSIMTSLLIESYGYRSIGRPQTPVFKPGRFIGHVYTSGDTIYYELNLTAIDNPTGARLVLGDISEKGVVVADLLQTESSITKNKKLGTLLNGGITDTSLQGSMKGKSLSDLITAIKDGNAYFYIQTPKGEIREQVKIHDEHFRNQDLANHEPHDMSSKDLGKFSEENTVNQNRTYITNNDDAR